MIDVSNEYLEAVKGIGREWKNTVTLSDGVHTETYDSASITITESFATDSSNLTIGGAFSTSCEITLYQPLKTVDYKRCEIKVKSGLLVGSTYEYVDMGIFYPSEVSTEDDYETLNITAYDRMVTLQETYKPTVSLPTTDSQIINDICEQYGLSHDVDIYEAQLIEGSIGDWSANYETSWDNGELVCKYNAFSPQGDFKSARAFIIPISLNPTHKYLYIDKNATTFVNEWYTGIVVNGTRYKSGDTITPTSQTSVAQIGLRYDYSSSRPSSGWLSPVTKRYKPMLIDLTLLYGSGNEPTYNEFVADYPNFYVHSSAFGTDRVIEEIYEATAMQTLGYMAGLQGKNAIINRDGNLEFKFYDTNAHVWEDYTNDAWTTLGNKTWNALKDTSSVLEIERDFQMQNGLKLLSDTPITIQGAISGTSDNPITIGDGLSVNFENPYINKNELEIALGNVSSLNYIPSELKYFGCPAVEVGDIVTVIGKHDEEYTFLVSSNKWNLHGGCNCETYSAGIGDNEITFSGSTTVANKVDSVAQNVKNINEQLQSLFSTGKFTVVTSSNGETRGWKAVDDVNSPRNIFLLDESGLKVSNDGGNTYKVVITGDGITTEISDLPIASATTLGGIKVGNNLTIDSDGTLNATGGGSSYTLPTASATTLGGVKVGDNLSISNGVLSATDTVYTLPTATSSTLGGVKVDESTSNSLLMALNTATNSVGDDNYVIVQNQEHNHYTARSVSVLKDYMADSLYTYKDYDFSVTYTAGTIGTRGYNGTTSVALTGYTPVSATVIATSTANAMITPVISGTTLYCTTYRTKTTAQTTFTATIRVFYIS